VQDFRNCKTILSFDVAFITEAVQEQILDVLIQIKRMLSGLAGTLTASIQKHRSRRRTERQSSSRDVPGVNQKAES
jgi:hypothetical protein